MVENEREVEEILCEIRERVRKENNALFPYPPPSANLDISFATNDSDALSEANNTLLLMKMNLTTTERTWSSLPPIGTYRSGRLARLELWLKYQIKRATRWFTWEQINFNSAVHQNLEALQIILSAHQQLLNTLQQQIESLNSAAMQNIRLQANVQNLPTGTENRSIDEQLPDQTDQLQNDLRDRLHNSPPTTPDSK